MNRALIFIAAFTAALAAGNAADDFTQAKFTDARGVMHQPAQVDFAKAHVLFFVLADCPISNAYAEEINAIAKAHTRHGTADVRCYLVHVDGDITPEVARKHAADFGYAMPVLLDREQRLARFAGATVAPSAAIVLPDGRIAYCGRIDDLYADYGKRRPAPTQHTLRAALDAVLAGKPVPQPRTKTVGCYIGGSR